MKLSFCGEPIVGREEQRCFVWKNTPQLMPKRIAKKGISGGLSAYYVRSVSRDRDSMTGNNERENTTFVLTKV